VNHNQHKQKILVPLRDHESVELFLPYVQELARPGSTIIFLVPISHSRFSLITDQLLAINTGFSAGSPISRNEEKLLASRVSSVKQEIFLACVALRENGVKIIVSVFAGSLRKVVRDYAQREDIHLIIMRGRAGNLLTRAARKLGFLANVCRTRALPPVLLFHASSSNGPK
jgi:nucleotide-binding universal stress UspA family protein